MGEEAGALGELAAGLVEHAVSPDGTVTPASAYRGFASYSFGQKRKPSAFATAQVLAVLHRLRDLPVQLGRGVSPTALAGRG